MIQKRILSRDRVRHPPQTGWSWVDRRFVREQADRLSRDALLLYFFLCAVADQHGLSYYGDITLAARLRLSDTAIAPTRPSQTPPGQTPPGHGLSLMRDILREAAGLPASHNPGQEGP